MCLSVMESLLVLSLFFVHHIHIHMTGLNISTVQVYVGFIIQGIIYVKDVS